MPFLHSVDSHRMMAMWSPQITDELNVIYFLFLNSYSKISQFWEIFIGQLKQWDSYMLISNCLAWYFCETFSMKDIKISGRNTKEKMVESYIISCYMYQYRYESLFKSMYPI